MCSVRSTRLLCDPFSRFESAGLGSLYHLFEASEGPFLPWVSLFTCWLLKFWSTLPARHRAPKKVESIPSFVLMHQRVNILLLAPLRSEVSGDDFKGLQPPGRLSLGSESISQAQLPSDAFRVLSEHIFSLFKSFFSIFQSFKQHNCFSTRNWGEKRVHCYFNCTIHAINSFFFFFFQKKLVLVDLKIKAFLRKGDIKFQIADLLAFKCFKPGNNFHVTVNPLMTMLYSKSFLCSDTFLQRTT